MSKVAVDRSYIHLKHHSLVMNVFEKLYLVYTESYFFSLIRRHINLFFIVCFISQRCLIQQIFFLWPFISASFVSFLCLALFAAADLVKQVRLLLVLSFQLVCFFTAYLYVVVEVWVRAHACSVFVCMCVCVGTHVSKMGLAEMSKAGSHAVSGAADIALAVGGLQGALLKVKEL